MKNINITVRLFLLVLIMMLAFTYQSAGQTKSDTNNKSGSVDKTKPGCIEAENYFNQEKGSVEKSSGRVEASKDIILGWNNAGHKIEWKFYIENDGDYKVVFRYCTSRSGTVYRELLIDKKSPGKAFEKIALIPTGGFAKSSNDWRNFTIPDANGNPAMVTLKAGEHILTITNLGGEGQDGGANFDSLAFLPKDANPDSVMGKPGKP